MVDVYLPGQTSTPSVTPSPTARHRSLPVSRSSPSTPPEPSPSLRPPTGLRLDSVTPAAGWTWSLTQTGPTELMVTMTDGVRTLEFVAATTADGNIAASVNEPIVTPAPPAANTGGYDDDEDDDDEEYEGGEDDD